MNWSKHHHEQSWSTPPGGLLTYFLTFQKGTESRKPFSTDPSPSGWKVSKEERVGRGEIPITTCFRWGRVPLSGPNLPQGNSSSSTAPCTRLVRFSNLCLFSNFFKDGKLQ